MNELLVAKDVLLNAKIGGGTISGINEINLLAAGALAVFDDSNTMLTSSNAAAQLVGKKYVYFAVGSGDATIGAKVSQPVPREPVNYVKKFYVAPVKQAIAIGLDNSAGSMNIPTIAVGDVAYLRVSDTDPENVNMIRAHRYEYTAKTGDDAAAITAGVIAAINADSNATVVATAIASNTGILLTAKEYGYTFQVSLDGLIVSATIKCDDTGSSLLPVFGSGTATEVAEIESEFNSEDGNTSRLYLASSYWKVASAVVAATNYDLVNIQFQQTHSSPTKTYPASDKQIIIAIPTAPSTFVLSDFQTIMTQAFGTASTNVEQGS